MILYITCVGILSSFYLLCDSMMVLCERRLHITSPIWAHRRTPADDGVEGGESSYVSLVRSPLPQLRQQALLIP